MDIDQFRVKPGQPVDLGVWTTDENLGHDKDDVKGDFDDLNDELEQLQELLYAERKHKVLVVIQATDTGGKDGTIRHVFDKVNPAGVKVAAFKKPTDEELAHDYLWRVHAHTPGNGEMTIFNRSHYEDVLIVRVHDFVPEKRWEKRYPKLTDWVEEHIAETLTFYRLPRQHHRHMKSTNLLERLNEEIKRRTRVVRIFPNQASCLRLIRALCAETHEDWLEGHRYINMDLLAEQKKEILRQAA